MSNTKISSVVAKKLLEVKRSFRSTQQKIAARKKKRVTKQEAEHRKIDKKTKSMDDMEAAHKAGDADYT